LFSDLSQLPGMTVLKGSLSPKVSHFYFETCCHPID
jgi:hypothetical protein